jgi:hypothetical protein
LNPSGCEYGGATALRGRRLTDADGLTVLILWMWIVNCFLFEFPNRRDSKGGIRGFGFLRFGLFWGAKNLVKNSLIKKNGFDPHKKWRSLMNDLIVRLSHPA